MADRYSVSTNIIVYIFACSSLLTTCSKLDSKEGSRLCFTENRTRNIGWGMYALSFPLDLKLEQVMALRPNDSIPQRRDTVADVKELVADVQLIPLLKKTSRDRPTHLQRTESEHYELYWRLADKGQFGTVASGFAWHRP